jgi:glyoxylase-like metal-dependent hydrolase (beta-lactamase superfamily II)
MITIKTFVFNPFMENTFLIYDETREALIIDPGCYESSEKEELKGFVDSNGLNVIKLINTHCHIDHCLGNKFVKDTFGVELALQKSEEEVLRSVINYAPAYGFDAYEETEADEYLDPGDILKFGNSELKVLSVPGHSPGHIALINTEEKICISGDVLFRESIGRTDLPGGNYDTLISSIHSQLFALPDDTIVYSGHGPVTTIGDEKQINPFCRVTS